MDKTRKTPRRSCVGRPPSINFVAKDNQWSVEELENLLKALKRHGKYDIESIQRYMPKRNLHEVQNKIQNLSVIAKTSYLKRMDSVVREDAPIEEFLRILYGIEDIKNDYSSLLGQVWDMIGFLEPHLKPSIRKTPDFGILYRYIGSLLQNHIPPPLTALEASVIMDCFNCLAVELANLDAGNQTHFVKQQWDILSKIVYAEQTVTEEANGIDELLKKEKKKGMNKRSVKEEENHTISQYKEQLKSRKLSSLNPLLIPQDLLNFSSRLNRKVKLNTTAVSNEPIGNQPLFRSLERNVSPAVEQIPNGINQQHTPYLIGNNENRKLTATITQTHKEILEKNIIQLDTVSDSTKTNNEVVIKDSEKMVTEDSVNGSIKINSISLENDSEENFVIDIEILPQSDMPSSNDDNLEPDEKVIEKVSDNQTQIFALPNTPSKSGNKDVVISPKSKSLNEELEMSDSDDSNTSTRKRKLSQISEGSFNKSEQLLSESSASEEDEAEVVTYL